MFTSKNRFLALSSLSVVLVVGAVACSKSAPAPSSAAPEPADEVLILAPMPVEENLANPLADLVRDGKPIPRQLLLENVFESQSFDYLEMKSQAKKVATDPEDLKFRLDEIVELAKENAKGGIPSKSDIDAELERHLDKPLAYDPEVKTLLDLLEADGLQCDSGSILHLYVQLASTTAPKYQATNPVMLMESGHYQPGFMIKQPVSGRYRLVGVDMTTSGNSVVDYGYADELATHPRVYGRGLRVMDAGTFLALEAMGEAIVDRKAYIEYEQKVLRLTAQKYGIKIDDLEVLVQNKFAAKQTDLETWKRRRRPGAFGDAGKLSRIEKRPEGSGSASVSDLPKLSGEIVVEKPKSNVDGVMLESGGPQFYAHNGQLKGSNWNGLELAGQYSDQQDGKLIVLQIQENGDVLGLNEVDKKFEKIGSLVMAGHGLRIFPAAEKYRDMNLEIIEVNPIPGAPLSERLIFRGTSFAEDMKDAYSETFPLFRIKP